RSRLIPILPAVPNNHQFSSTSHSSSNINLLSDRVDDNTTRPDYHSVYTYLSWSLKYNSRDLIDERMDIGEKPELTSKGKVILKSFIDHLINNTNELFTQRQRKFIMQKLYLLKQALTPGGNEKITIGSSTLSNPLSIPSDLFKSVTTSLNNNNNNKDENKDYDFFL
ncbi:8356_t:CDS:2, partial [Entrophospora sp. SA101]